MSEFDNLLNRYLLTKENSVLAELVSLLYDNGYATFDQIEKYLTSIGWQPPPYWIKDLVRYSANNTHLLPITVNLLAKRGYSLRKIYHVFKRYSIGKEIIWDCNKNYPLGTTAELIHGITQNLKIRRWFPRIGVNGLEVGNTYLGIMLDNHPLFEMGTGGRVRTRLQPTLRYHWEGCNVPKVRGLEPSLLLEDWDNQGFVINFAKIEYSGRVHGSTPTIRYRINLNNIEQVLDRLAYAAVKAQQGDMNFSGGRLVALDLEDLEDLGG